MDVTSPKANLRIFLSYSSEQLNLAEQIYQRLKNLGHRVFFDRTTLNSGGNTTRPFSRRFVRVTSWCS
jgi:hypothetical protein